MKKGFTLIEMLGVVSLLVVISLIAIPIVLNSIDNMQKSAFEETVNGLIKTIDVDTLNRRTNFETIERIYNLPNDSLEIQGKQPNGVIEVDVDGNLRIDVYDERWCAKKEFSDGSFYMGELYGETCILD